MSLQVGDRVRYRANPCATGHDYMDGATGVLKRFYDHTKRALIRIDIKPEYWPYPTLEFAPLVSQLEKIE